MAQNKMVKVSKSSRKSVAQCTLERQRNIIKQQNDLNAQLQKEKDALVAANVILIEQSAQESATLREKLRAKEEAFAGRAHAPTLMNQLSRTQFMISGEPGRKNSMSYSYQHAQFRANGLNVFSQPGKTTWRIKSIGCLNFK